MENLLKDIRYGFRVLLKSPAFTIVAVLSLALGIGANTAIFSIVSSFVFAPLPVEQADRLVSIFTSDAKNPGNLPTSHLNYIDYRDKNDALTDVAAFTFSPISFSNNNQSKQIFAFVTSGNYFDVLGARAISGRTFSPDEDRTPNTHPVVVLSYAFWQRELGGDPDIIGKPLTLNRHPFNVIGVMPRDFTGTVVGFVPDLWVPMAMHEQVQPDFDWYNERRGLFLFMIGRLKPETSLEQAQSSMTMLGTQLEQGYPKENTGRNVKLIPLLEARTNPNGQGQLMLITIVLMATAGIVLLIACANVANLLLSRATARRREFAIRLAIGASRRRLIRQLLTESLLLSIISGAVGFLVALWTRDILWSLTFGAGGGANSPEVRLDSRVMIFTVVVTILSGLVFGLVPALQAAKPDLVPTLKGEAAAPSRRRFPISLRKALVTAQVALSLVSLIGAGLFLRSLENASSVSPGFSTENLLMVGFDLGREGYSEANGKVFQRQMVERVQNIAGVRAVSLAQSRPFFGFFARSVFVEGKEPPPGGRGQLVSTNPVGLRFFETMGIAINRGRDFNEGDSETAPLRVIINETMAEQFWPGEDALGTRFKFFGDSDFREVIGIAKDTKYNSLIEERQPFVYLPFAQQYGPAGTIYIRTSGDAASMTAAVRGEIAAMDSSLPLLNVITMEEHINNSLGGQRSNATLLAIFGGLALLLAVIGLYGVMAYTVAQRTREIGIRMALGAQRGDVLRLVLKQGLLLVSVGIVLGLIAAFIASKFISGLLFGVTALDPAAFGLTSLLLAAVALIASYVPARKAMKVDPLIALRYE
jgi:macrolide transport system ATP-binding/permease protein